MIDFTISYVGSLRCGLRYFAAFLTLLAGGLSASHAAPVTFRFEAQVTEIEGDISILNLPFSLAVGEIFSGQYSFNSHEDLFDIFQGIRKQGIVTLNFDTTTLETSTNFGTLNDGGLIDINNPPLPGPISSLSLGYLSPTDVFPGLGGGVASHPAGVGLALVGPEGVIAEPEDILDVQTWNQLTSLRQLSVQIGYPTTISIHATVGNFVSVPEPTTNQLTFALLIVGLAFLRNRNFFLD